MKNIKSERIIMANNNDLETELSELRNLVVNMYKSNDLKRFGFTTTSDLFQTYTLSAFVNMNTISIEGRLLIKKEIPANTPIYLTPNFNTNDIRLYSLSLDVYTNRYGDQLYLNFENDGRIYISTPTGYNKENIEHGVPFNTINQLLERY